MATLAELEKARRTDRFVGRATELRHVAASLAREPGSRPIVFVYGPGGVGKTALIDAARAATPTPGIRWVEVDATAVSPDLAAVQELLSDVSDPGPDLVIRIDSYERLAHLDGWFRTEFVPRLPSTSRVVITCRQPPPDEWMTSPLVQMIALRNLAPKESHELLDTLGVVPELRSDIIAATHGHPLALALLADYAQRTGKVETAPELVATLLRTFVGSVPTERHRRAMEVCALARVTTEDLLRAALDEPDVGDVFAWLREQCFVQAGSEGLYPHDLARDALDADLSWRDPQRYEELFRRISRHLVSRLTGTRGPAQVRAILDAKYMHRYHPVSRGFADWETFGQSYTEPAQLGDLDQILAIIDRWEGPESVRLAQAWYDVQPQGFFVVRHTDNQVRGTLVAVDLSAASEAIVSVDPVAQAAIDAVTNGRGLRPGQRVTCVRFAADRELYQQASPTWNVAPVLSIQHYLTTPGLTADVLAFFDDGRWDEYLGFFEIRRAERETAVVGGRRYALFVRDFRKIPLDDWLELMLEHDLSGPPTPPIERPVEVVALSQSDFADAVRDALRHLRDARALRHNPLTRSRLVPIEQLGPEAAPALSAAIIGAAERLRANPREEHLYRVLDRTYLRPAATQEKAAAVLDLPMSTYKRHLRRAVSRVTENLWEREVSTT